MEFDKKEYLDYVNNGISGKLTRGLVVSTEDPLYSGRVKVWIPILHGGFTAIDTSNETSSEDTEPLLQEDAGTDFLGELTTQGIECLPWAPVMGSNWGPTKDLSNTENGSYSIFGVFNVPKVGTEVFIIFEDDNPNMPVVLGSAFHEFELLSSTKIKPLEISPGILIGDVATDEKQDYENRVAESYLIRSNKGSQLCISDITGQEQIILGGAINLATKPTIIDDGDPKSKYSIFSTEYPNFPTTASAPFKYRQSINVGTTKLNSTMFKASSGTSVPTEEELAAKKQASALAGVDTSVVSTPDAPTVAQANSSVTITKRMPIKGSWPAVKSTDPRAFGFRRSYEVHQGIDLSVTKVDVVAPIDCVVLSYRESTSAGTYIIVEGVDGWKHAFLHLDSVEPLVKKAVLDGERIKYSVGTKLATTGNTGHCRPPTGGYHLHWEVFKGDREKIRRQVPWGTIGFMNPLAWVGSQDVLDQNGNTANNDVILSAAQIEAYSSIFNAGEDSASDKAIGLEIAMTPGAEHIFLRHPSGGYAGFDADGNWKVFTTGNAEYRINRNLVFDVLGGVMTSCLAFYTKAMTAIKLISPAHPKLLTSSASANLPKIFERIESSRQKDMDDALKASASNVYYNLTANSLGKSLANITKDRFATTHVPVERDYTISKFDALIRAAHAKYIPTKHVLASVLTPALIKSVMLQESNGDPTAGKGSYVGLFQIGAKAIQDITKQKSVSIEMYRSVEPNIEIGVQYILKCANIMLGPISNKSNLSDKDKQSILMAALMGYNYGPYGILELYKTVVNQSNTIDYVVLEERFVNSTLFTKNQAKGMETLNYAPNVMYIKGKVNI